MKKSHFPVIILSCLLMAGAIPVRAADLEQQKRDAYDVVERNARAIATVGDALYYYAELGMQEFESARLLKETLEGIGFSVEVGGAGMEGHNTHGGVAVGAAYAIKRTMERYNLPGTLVLSFGPAEEQKDTPYFSLLPPDARPPLDMNREMMERYRPEMRKHYPNARPRFE